MEIQQKRRVGDGRRLEKKRGASTQRIERIIQLFHQYFNSCAYVCAYVCAYMCFFALAISIAVPSVFAATVTPSSIMLGESVLVHTTAGANGLVLNCDGQSYRYLGALDATVAYKPSQIGVCSLIETQGDGTEVTTTFIVSDGSSPMSDISVNMTGDTITGGAAGAAAGGAAGVTPGITDPTLSVGLPQIDLTQNVIAPQAPSGSRIQFVRNGKLQYVDSLEEDEVGLSNINPDLRIRTSRGTGWIADVTLRAPGGKILGNTNDLGARVASVERQQVTVTFRKRHVKSITLENTDISQGLNLGVDEPAASIIEPIEGRTWVNVFAIDPTNVSFTGGQVSATAEGTELYKCKDWNFSAQVCGGTWVKLMDLAPGTEYSVALSSTDPGFAESVINSGTQTISDLSNISITASVPSPLKNTVGTWGIVINNPTNLTLNITSVRITASAAVLSALVGVKPKGGWTLFSTTVANWTNLSGVILGPVDTAEFIFNITGPNVNNLNTRITVNFTSNIVNLTNAGYLTHSTNAALQYVSVYFVNSTNSSMYAVPNVAQNASVGYTVRLENRGTSTVTPGSSMLMFIPPGWHNISAAAQAGWNVNTIEGDEYVGWLMQPRLTSTIATGSHLDFTINATPPDADNISLYGWNVRLIGNTTQNARGLSTVFEPSFDVNNITRLILEDDNLTEVTRTAGGARNLDQFISVGAPFDSPGANRWGVVVVNPGDTPINVTQIDIQTNQNVFAAPTAIVPAVTWSLVSASNVRWNGTATVAPHSASEFVVNMIATAATTLQTDITVTTVTTGGTLTTTGFRTSQSTGTVSTPTICFANSTQQSYMRNLSPSVSHQFALRINNSGASGTVPAGTAIEVILPPGWTNVTSATTANWTVQQVSSDASSGAIVRAITIGTIATNTVRDFFFNATAPRVNTNSTYRFDVLFYGGTAQTTIMPIQTQSQLAVRLFPTIYGINLTRSSENVTNMHNITSITLNSRVSAFVPTFFNLSIRNATTGTYETYINGTLNASETSWMRTISSNRTFDVRAYIDRNTGSASYGRILFRWETASGNQTALVEDLFEFNTTNDTIIPNVTLLLPQNASYLNISNQTFIANTSDDYDLQNCTLYIDGLVNQTNTTPSNGTNTTFFVTGIVDGQHNWSVRCIDIVGNVNMTSNFSFIMDTKLPNVILTSPQNNSKHTGPVKFNMTPSDVNIANCSLYIDDALNDTNLTPTSNAPWSVTHVVVDGMHNWTGSCTDRAGNAFTNHTLNFSVDTTPPGNSNIFDSPASPAVYSPSTTHTFNVAWNDGNGISTVYFEENFTGTLQNHTASTVDGENYTYSWSSLAVDGYAWRMYANDTFGNWNMTPLQPYEVSKDTAIVDLYLNDTIENYPVDINESVNITAILANPLVGYIELYVNNTLVASGNNRLENITSFSTTGSRNVTVIYYATKNYTEARTTLFITVGDKGGPLVNITAPANNSFMSSGNITVEFNISDDTGIDNCTVRVRNETDMTPWWDSRRTYRQQVNITEKSNTNLTNFTALVSLNSSNFDFALAQQNGSDLRVTIINDNGVQTNTTFWIETWNTTTNNASVWVNIPLLNASKNRTIYLYYGNPVATSASNGTAAFLLWGDFSVNRIGTYWQTADNDLVAGTSFVTTNGILNVTAGGTDTWTANDEYGSVFSNVTGDFIATVKINSQQNTNAWAKAGIMVRNNMSARTTSTGYVFATVTPGNGYSWQRDAAAVNGYLDTNEVGGSPSVYSSRVKLIKNGSVFLMQYSKDNATWTQVGTNQTLASANNLQDIGLSVTSHAGATLSSVIFDDFYVRRYAALEPTVAFGGVDAFIVNGTSAGPFANPGPSTINITGQQEGNYSITVTCYDPLGNLGASAISRFTVDLTPPTSFTLLTPTSGTISKNQTPTLTWQASTDTYLANYTIYLTKTSDFSLILYNYTSSATSYAVNDILDPNTVWYWNVVANDLAGNTREASQFNYTIDITPPQFTSLDPPNGTQQNFTTLNLTYSFTDVGNVTNCTARFNDSTSYSNVDLNQSGINNFTLLKSEGDYLWNITCSDSVNNSNTSDRPLLIIDLTPPTSVTLTGPGNNTFTKNNTPTLTWTQTTERNFANYTIEVSEINTFSYTNYSYAAYTQTTPAFDVTAPWSDGQWFWRVVTYDVSGNSNKSGVFSYTIDALPPTAFDLLTPVNNTASTVATPTLVWSESNDSNFANYTILVTDNPTFSTINRTYNTTNSSNTTYEVGIAWTMNIKWYWRVIAWDNATNSVNSTSTFLYITDNRGPNITLLSPTNNTVYNSNTSSLITFIYNVSDLSDVDSCTLITNQSGTVSTTTDFFIQKDQNQSFVASLITGLYNWSVECNDSASNIGRSNIFNLSVNISLPKLRLYDSAPFDNPQVNTTVRWGAIAVYGNLTGGAVDSVPKYRTWNGSNWSAQASMPNSSSPLRWIKMASSPAFSRPEEKIAVTLSNDGYLDAYVWNGSSWALYPNVGSVGLTANNGRSYDIEYETQRGRAMLLYAVNTTNTSRDLAYRFWNGSDWSQDAFIDDRSSAADMQMTFIRLARNPIGTSNELATAYLDSTNTAARALIWNGTNWTTPVNITTAVSFTTKEDVGIAYEQQTTRIMAVAASGTGVVSYAYYNRSTWNQTGTFDPNAAATSTINWLRVKSNPAGNDIMVIAVDQQASPDLSAGRWSGGAWVNTGQRDPGLDSVAQRPADFDWDPTGSTGILVYGTTAGSITRQTFSTVSSWGAATPLTTGANAHTWILAERNPGSVANDARVLIMAQEATSQQLDGAFWNGTLVDQNAAFTTSMGTIANQTFDIAFNNFPTLTGVRYTNITLNSTVDGTSNLMTMTGEGLQLLTNATSMPISNYGTIGFGMPKGSVISYTTLLSALNPGVSYFTWEAYRVNASGEYLLCRNGNRSRGTEMRLDTTDIANTTTLCIMNNATTIYPDDTLRIYLYVNSSVNNSIIKYVDNLSTYVDFDGFSLGNLSVQIVTPLADPQIGEGKNFSFTCTANCTGGYCVNVIMNNQLNDSPTTYNNTDYFIGNIVLNSTTNNPVLLSTINESQNVSYDLVGSMYSFNNSMMCFATSDYINATSSTTNVTVHDNVGPNITLIDPPDGSGYDPQYFTFTFNASDRRIGNCSLWGNWSGSWARNQTITPNNGTPSSFSPINISTYGTYKWNVNCSDLAGNNTYATTNFTFSVAGDLAVYQQNITFVPIAPVEGEVTTINAVLFNRAGRNETNVKVGFYVGDPRSGNYTQIGSNVTVAFVQGYSNVTVNTTYVPQIGVTPIFVLVDPQYGGGDIIESNKTNNIANTTLYVSLWQVYYGNISGSFALVPEENSTFSNWTLTNITGNIYVSCSDTTNGISFATLHPIYRNTTGGFNSNTINDFEEIDTLMGTFVYNDSINLSYTSGGTPRALENYSIYAQNISNVSVVNSSVDGNFTTGVLWDSSESTNAYYDTVNKEDLVFITKIQNKRASAYGIIDYELRVPSTLKSYKGTSNTVTFYYEIQ